MRTNKFEYVTVLQANYGYGNGWEDIGEGTRKAMRAELATYRVNMPDYPYRLINRRNLINRGA